MSMHVGELNLGGHPNFDPHHLFVGVIPYMVDQARYAAEHDAVSYRGFVVGAAVFAINPYIQQTAILAAGNVKNTEHITTVCAEPQVLAQAEKLGLTTALGIVVAGTTDREEIIGVNKVDAPTLHPCEPCQIHFEDNPLVRGDTIVISTGLEDDTYQVHTVKELKQMYKNKKKHFPSQESYHGFENWATKQAVYDLLASAERVLPENERRTPSALAMMAIKHSA